MDKNILKPKHIKLPKETELMEQVLDNAQVAIVITDNDHKVEYVNPEFTRIFGYPREAAIEKYTYDLVVPEDRRVELEQLTEQLDRLERSEYETIRCSKDGRRIDVLCRLSPIIQGGKRVGGFAFYSDISERKRSQEEMQKAHDELEMRVKSRTRELREANKKLKSEIRERKRIEEELRESEEGYRTAIENSNDGVIIVQGRRYVYVNQRHADIYGYESPDEIIGKSMNQFIHTNDIDRVSELARRRQKGELPGQQYEHKGIRKDGTPILPSLIPLAPCCCRFEGVGEFFVPAVVALGLEIF